MKRVATQTISIVFALGLPALPAAADSETNLIPTIENVPDVCPDRPDEPDWMQHIPLRDAYQRVLVQDIYRAQNMERIIETNDCACAVRFPPWDTAEATFQENHANADRLEMLEASDAYNRRANTLRVEAKTFCEAEGNW